MVPIYMAKPNFPEKQTAPTPPSSWGTWEDLLLACAVGRYGTESWDSVAGELRKRTSALHILTPQTCKQKFHDLRRRFARSDVVSPPPELPRNDDVFSIPFLEDLRRLRVAELRREVERYDLSIVSLETKVEKLKEEREQSLKESGDEKAEKPDLEQRQTSEILKPANESPEVSAGKEGSGEGSVHDKRFSDESNAADLKETREKPPAAEDVPVSDEKPAAVVEDSYDGSSETVAAKGSAAVSPAEQKVENEERVGGDSAESKGGRVEEEEEGAKEVCSSTSLPRKKPDEPDEPDDSEDGKRAHSGDVESQSLVGFLEILRSHQSGSLIEHRQEIQETPSYTNMIRQHIDFETIRIRLDEGWYSGCKIKFFRDLMLVLNNAIVFFGKKAPESTAATKLRSLVRREMTAQSITAKIKLDSAPKEETSAPDSKPEPSDTFLRKPKISVPMNACRKRSSIAARAGSGSSSGPERKKEPSSSALLDSKPTMGWKQSGDKSAEESPAEEKKGKKERPKANTRSNNLSNKNSGGASAGAGPSTRGGGGGAGNENSASKSDKKENSSGKKRSATNFLNRMKRGSPLVEASKDSGGGRGGSSEQRKNGGGGGGGKPKEQPPPPSRASLGKQAKEPESPAKRSVGRPSKRPAAAPAASSPAAKRSRQSGEAEASRNSKKRSRK